MLKPWVDEITQRMWGKKTAKGGNLKDINTGAKMSHLIKCREYLERERNPSRGEQCKKANGCSMLHVHADLAYNSINVNLI